MRRESCSSHRAERSGAVSGNRDGIKYSWSSTFSTFRIGFTNSNACHSW